MACGELRHRLGTPVREPDHESVDRAVVEGVQLDDRRLVALDQIEKANSEDELVPAIARIVRKPTLGYNHLAEAGRDDLMVEQLVVDPTKPYHQPFVPRTIQLARERLDE